MTSLIRSLIGPPRVRSQSSYTLDDYVDMLRNAGLALSFTYQPDREQISGDFPGLVHGAYESNGVVFGAIMARALVFSEARFQWQQMRGGQPGDLFGTNDLAIYERPEPTLTTGDLLLRALVDHDLAGNWFGIRQGDRLKRVRPDWCWLIMGTRSATAASDPDDVNAELVGLVYQPGGPYSDSEPQTFAVGEFAHFKTAPDPLARYRGMSWLTPVIRNIRGHSAATTFKGRFFQNAATPNIAVRFPEGLPKERAQEWIEVFEQEHAGALNAFRTAYLGGGADLTVVGSTLEQLDMKAVQGADETVIALAARVPPVILGISEGLAGSALNAGNYNSSKRQFGDGTIRPLWRFMAGALEDVTTPPGGSRLWYDDRHIPFLAEDQKDAADVFSKEASAIRTLTDGGYLAPSVVAATASRDVRLLEHSGYLPVQVQPIQGDAEEEAEPAVAAFAQVVPATRLPALPIGGDYAARETFWPVSGPAAGLHVEAGMVLPADHYLVRAFPQRFEPVTEGRAVHVSVRCTGCNALLAEEATAPYRLRCHKSDCKTLNVA